jgi:trimethylguanosine synthase
VEEPAVKTKSSKRKMKKMFKNRPPEVKAPHMHKYWAKRYQLFSKFDEGIKLDQGKAD